jgi:hypothetical protein
MDPDGCLKCFDVTSIILGTEYFDGKSSKYVDYPLTDVLQMIGRAGRPGFDTEAKAVVMVADDKKVFFKKVRSNVGLFFSAQLPVLTFFLVSVPAISCRIVSS